MILTSVPFIATNYSWINEPRRGGCRKSREYPPLPEVFTDREPLFATSISDPFLGGREKMSWAAVNPLWILNPAEAWFQSGASLHLLGVA